MGALYFLRTNIFCATNFCTRYVVINNIWRHRLRFSELIKPTKISLHTQTISKQPNYPWILMRFCFYSTDLICACVTLRLPTCTHILACIIAFKLLVVILIHSNLKIIDYVLKFLEFPPSTSPNVNLGKASLGEKLTILTLPCLGVGGA